MLVFVSKLIILSYMMASTAAARRIHTSSDGTVREYINKQWIVISITHATNNEILFLPSREFNVNFDDGEFLINDLPVLVTAKGKSRKSDEEIDGDTGLTIWDGSILLAKALESFFENNTLLGKNVLELGSGVGVVGISAAALGGNVVMTDLEYTKDQIETNIKRAQTVWGNEVGGNMHFQKLDWLTDHELYNNNIHNNNVKQESFLYYEKFDYILGADIVWLEPLILPLVRLLDVITAANKNCKVLISYQSRSKRADDILFHNLAKKFVITELEKQHWPKGYETEKIKIIILTRLS